MTPHVGYDPQRIRRLVRATIESIEAFDLIRSDEPAAADAVRAARNARRNLEDAWMPLLREIESSDAMVAARGLGVAGLRAEWSATARWLGAPGGPAVGHDALLVDIARLDEQVPLVDDDESRAEYDTWLSGQRDLAIDIARRVRADPEFADRLIAAAYSAPVIGLLVGLTDFPADFRADLLAATLADPWWESGWEMDKYAGAASTLIGSMLDDPARCLDVLGRDGAAAALAGWPPLDQDLVAGFFVAALGEAPLRDRDLLPVGYASLKTLVGLANEQPFDGDGFQPGAATGLAHAIAVYVPSLIQGLENEHVPVEVKSLGADSEFDLELGTREEVVDFFGAIVRTQAAQVELGAVIGASVRDALGPRPQVTVGDVAEFAELIDLAVDNEDEELAIAASTRRTSMLRVGGMIGLGIAVGTALAGVSSASRSVAEYASANVTGGVAGTVRADTVGGSRVRAIAYQSIQIEACRRFVADPDLRRAHGAGAVGAGPLRSIDARLTDLGALLTDPDADPGERQRAILNVVGAVRAAGGGPYLDAVLEENSVDDLTEADSTADL